MRSLTIAGEERWQDVDSSTFIIKRALTYAIDTCTFYISGDKPEEGDEIIVTSDGARLFAGIVIVSELVDKIFTRYSIQCEDYTAMLDQKLVVEVYENMTADAIFLDIVSKYCSGFTTTGVQTGAPLIESTGSDFEYKRPSECFKWLCKYIGWHWQPSYYKDLQFFSADNLTNPAPMTLEVGGEFKFGKHKLDIQGIRNRIFVRGGTLLSDFQTISWKADGVATSWVLPWKPHEVSLVVNAVAKTVGIENVDDESTHDYMYNFEQKYLRCSSQTSAPTSGYTMSLTAKQDIDIITVVEDFVSQEAIAEAQGGALLLTYSMNEDANAYLYADLIDITDYTIQSGDYVEYDIYWGKTLESFAQVVFDFTTTDDTTFRLSGAVDQNDYSPRPSTDISAYCLGQWYHRKFAVPSALVGKVIEHFDLVCEYDKTAIVIAQIKDVQITDGNGTIRKNIWSVGDAVPNFSNRLINPAGNTLTIVTSSDGVYEHVINDDTLKTIEAAEAAGYADLRDNANPKVKGDFETCYGDWYPGQLLEINLTDRNVTGTYLVQNVSITPFWPDPNLWTYKVEYGGRLLSIADVLQALVSAEQQKEINATAILHKYIYGLETISVSDVLYLTEIDLPLYCGDAEAICGLTEVSNGA